MLLLGPVGTEEAGRGASCSRSSSSHSCRDPRAGGLLRLRGGARDAQGDGGRETLVPGPTHLPLSPALRSPTFCCCPNVVCGHASVLCREPRCLRPGRLLLG